MTNIINDQAYMAQALRLARQGLYTTRSNPKVGCVIVKDNQIIGQGFHAYPGKEHAEINALNSINGSAEGATAYVTLEPCSHQGKTPPCINALIDAKISKVVAAMLDPNSLVNGKGLQKLEESGIETLNDVMSAEAARLNKGFIKRITQNRPYVTAKSATSMDGKTAMQSGESKWISCEASRMDVQKYRARSCAILTGIDTVKQDNPSLDVRLSKDDLGLSKNIQQPKRIILDTHLRIAMDAKILATANEVILYTCSEDKQKIEMLSNAGVMVIKTEISNDHVCLNTVMQDLASKEINEVLVEAGSTLVGNLLEQQLIDEFVLYIAPHIMGDDGLGLAKLPAIQSMQDRIELNIQQVRKIGTDLKLKITPNYIK